MLSGNQEVAFTSLAREVFALDMAIQWFVLENAGREPCYARRDGETGEVLAATRPDCEIVDPLVLMLAEGRDGLYGREEGGNPHGLLFVVLVYQDWVEIVAQFGPYGRAGVGIDRNADACSLGTKLTELLDHTTKESCCAEPNFDRLPARSNLR